MKKRILSIVLSIVMLVSLLPTTALAIYDPQEHALCQVHNCTVDHNGNSNVEDDHTAVTFEAWTYDNSLPTTPGNYYLTKDVELLEGYSLISGTVTLCLNGHSITLPSGEVGFSVSGTFNLTDCGTETRKGYIDATTNLWKALGEGELPEGAVPCDLTGGVIIGGSHRITDTGGGVQVSGTFNMYGGNIAGNYSINCGGVYVKNNFNMYGGTITGNKATSSSNGGGGVHLTNSGTFNMYGGTIQYNKTTANGGGVYKGNGTINMSGGTIRNNTAGIHGNGGGVYYDDNSGNFYISGSPVITGNTDYSRENADNVYLCDGKFMVVNGVLTENENTNIGVKMAVPGVFAQPDGTTVTGHVGRFTSDDPGYKPAVAGENLSLVSTHEHGNWAYEYEDGTITATCHGTIGTCTVNTVTAEVAVNSAAYNGTAQVPVTVNCSANWTSAGAGTVTATGNGVLIGEGTATLTVGSASVENGTVSYNIGRADLTATYFTYIAPDGAPLIYTGFDKTATVTANISDVGEVTVKYYDSNGTQVTETKNAGTYTVKIDVAESTYYNGISGLTDGSWTFTVAPLNISQSSSITIELSGSAVYTGSEVKPDVTVYDGSEKVLIKDQDYRIVGYANNIDVGTNTASVTVTGNGNYTGTKTVYFSIVYPTKAAGEAFGYTYDADAWYNGTNAAEGVVFTPVENWNVSDSPNGEWQSSITFTEEGSGVTKTVYVKDGSNNIYSVELKYNYDKTAPVSAASRGGSPGENGWYVSWVTVQMSGATDSGSGVTKYEYSIDGGNTWTALDSGETSFTVNEEGDHTDKIQVRVTDKAGNVSEVNTVTAIKIDLNTPVISGVAAEPSDWTSGNVTLHVDATDSGSGIEAYKFGDGEWQTNNSKVFAENGTVTVSVKDNAGKISSTTYTIETIDKTKPGTPVISAKVGNASYASGNWTAGNVVIDVSATDVGSEIKGYQYSVDGESWTYVEGETMSLTHSENTEATGVTYRFVAVDMAGNVSETAASITVKRNALSADELAATEYGSDNLKIGDAAVSGNWYSTLPTVTVEKEATVGIDGLDATTYYELYKAPATGGSKTELTGDSIAILSDGEWTLKIWTEDTAGNKTAPYTTTIKTDTIAPEVSETLTPSVAAGSWTKEDITVSFTASDATSGIASVQYKLGDGSYADCTAGENGSYSFVAAENGTYTVLVTDNAGKTTERTITVSNIDKTEPVIEAGHSGGANTGATDGWKTGATYTVNITEENLDKWEYSIDGGLNWTDGDNTKRFGIPGDGEYSVLVRATDLAGNVTTVDAPDVKVDNTEPDAVTVTAKVGGDDYVSGEWTTGDVAFTLSASDATSGMQKYQYTTDGGETWTDITGNTYTHTASTDETGVTYKFRAVDNAGNVGEASDSITVKKRQPYTITFNANGGTGNMDSLTAYVDTQIELTENAFTREGYTFTGWNTAADGTGDVYADKASVTNLAEMNQTAILYAQWAVNEYKVTWINYGDDGWEKYFDYGESITLPTISDFAIMMQKLGYTQTGWLCSDDTVEIGDTMPAKDLTFTAQYTPNTYTVKFDANGGTGEMADQSFTYDAAAQALTTNAYTCDGYKFMGWAESADATGVDYVDKQVVSNLTAAPNGVVTLYAVWTRDIILSGDIVAPNVSDAENLDVVLVGLDGTEYPVSVTGSQSPYHYTVTVPEGEYQLIVKDTQNDVTVTAKEDLSEDKTEEPITLPAGNKNSIVDSTAAGDYAPIVGGIDTIAKNTEGSNVTVTLTVTHEESDDNDQEHSALMTEAGAQKSKLIFLEIGIVKKVDTNPEESITETSSTIEIVVPFDTTRKQNFKVYRFHDGTVDVLTTTANTDGEYIEIGTGSVTIHAKKFSLYAIGYTDVIPYYPVAHSCISKCDVCGGCEDAACAESACKDKCRLLGMNFTDVAEGKWYTEAIEYVYHRKMMEGVGNNLFDINGTTTRAMIVTILWRLEGEPVVNYLMQFEDIPAETWYTEAVRWAASEGIVEGYSDTAFGPTDPITREQFAAILWRYARYKGYDVSVGENTNILSYEDAFSISEYAIPAMQWACGAGLMQGDGVNLTPKADATRAQAAALFQRFCENVAEK